MAEELEEIDPNSEEWEELANQEARNFAPEIYPCGKCNYPVASGYCCNYCGDTDPETPLEDEVLEQL